VSLNRAALLHRASAGIFSATLTALAALTLVACGSEDSKSDGGSAGSDGADTGGGPGSGGGTSDGSGGSATGGGGATFQEPRVGNFDVALNDGQTSIQGWVRDAPVNQAVAWDLAETLDGCDLLTPRAPFCDPQCDVSATCVEDGVCLANPTEHSVGVVTITGVDTEDGGPVTLNPIGNRYPPAAAVLYPPAPEGASIQLSTEGGDYAPFTVTGTGIAPLTMLNQLNADQTVDMTPDQDLALQWQPPGAQSDARIEIEIDISHHGGARGLIRCFVDDTGSFSVPQALVSGLIDLGVAGFPTVKIIRRSRGSVQIEPGRVDLDVFSGVELNLNIPGYISCDTNADCVAVGMTTCQNNRTCA
jgi:hypothetical protein